MWNQQQWWNWLSVVTWWFSECSVTHFQHSQDIKNTRLKTSLQKTPPSLLLSGSIMHYHNNYQQSYQKCHPFLFTDRFFWFEEKYLKPKHFPACVSSSGCQNFLGHIRLLNCVSLMESMRSFCVAFLLHIVMRWSYLWHWNSYLLTVIFRIFCTFQSPPLHVVSYGSDIPSFF